MSDDGSTALVVIALLGSPFSPAYARARGRGVVDPLDYSAFNVSISRADKSRWALTERRAAAVARDASSLAIGRSSMEWNADGSLVISIDEKSAPWGRPVRGKIVFWPSARTTAAVPIDGAGEHYWWPIAPLGRVDVALDEPGLRFGGTGYLDANSGTRPLEESFASWSWARMSTEDSVSITYDVVTRDAGAMRHGYVVDAAGLGAFEGAAHFPFRRTRFGLDRSIRSVADANMRLVRTVEDGPFYARSLVEARDRGRLVRGVHEVVSLDRFASSWVQFLIPFRMRRETP